MESFGDLIRSETPVLVDFYAEWCGPCKALEPTIKEVAQTLGGKARIIKVNVDANIPVAQAYSVNAVPTLMLFRKGQVLWRHPGMIDKAKLISIIEKHMNQVA